MKIYYLRSPVHWFKTVFVIVFAVTWFTNLQSQNTTSEFAERKDNISVLIQVNVINVIAIYPNPTIDNLTIYFELSRASNLTILVYNSHMELVAQPSVDRLHNIGNNSVELNLSNQPSGYYYYRILAKDKVQATGKIQKL